MIIHNNVKIFPNTIWPAHKELSLIELCQQFGFANWSDISRKMKTHDAVECRNHYIKNYFDGMFWKTCKLTKYPYCRTDVPYLYNRNSFDPPRMSSGAVQMKLMADYQFARSEFNTQFDASAELVISSLDNDEWNDEFSHIGESLKCALVNAYNNRLR